MCSLSQNSFNNTSIAVLKNLDDDFDNVADDVEIEASNVSDSQSIELTEHNSSQRGTADDIEEADEGSN